MNKTCQVSCRKENTPGKTETKGRIYVPRVDACETEQAYILYAELPGANADAISLEFDDGVLTLKAPVLPRQVGKKAIHVEYGVGEYQRQFQIGEPIDAEQIAAEFLDGVLAIHLPKQTKAANKKISIKSSR